MTVFLVQINRTSWTVKQLKAGYKKETLQDPQDREKNYDNFTLNRETEFCCDKFRLHCKKSTGWDYDKGKFGIVDKITYDGHSTEAIDFCPFCGEEIEYMETLTKNIK